MSNIDKMNYEAKRIGEFLACSKGTLQNAVKKQGQLLKQKKPFKTIGQILIENGDISKDDWETAIRKQRIHRLRSCPVFASLSDTELSALSSRFSEVTVDIGEQFITQDMPEPTLYILASGKVEVYRTEMNGTRTHIAYVEPPEPIGEMGYFSGGVRTASVRALTTSTLLCAHYKDLTHYFEHVPRVAHEFMRIVEARRQATEEILKKP
ncbi:MAG: cyclic nucleotide-binding domain-containing protein [Gammaproteobacteria bacterium]|nr:MAG: cyclic nucleotide-binding domain-containing protein [Gammaproteobacteria bacterium]